MIEPIKSIDTSEDESEDKNEEIDKVEQVKEDECKKKGDSTGIKVVNLGNAGMIHGPKGEVYISGVPPSSKPNLAGASNLTDTEVFISNPDIYTQQIKALLSRIESNPDEKSQKDPHEDTPPPTQIDSKRTLRKRSTKVANHLIAEDSDQGQERLGQDDSEYEPSETEPPSESESDLDQAKKDDQRKRLAKLLKSASNNSQQGQKPKDEPLPEPMQYQSPDLLSNEENMVKSEVEQSANQKSQTKLKVKLPIVPIVVIDSDDEASAKNETRRRLRRRRNKPLPIRKPIFDEDSDQGLNQKGEQHQGHKHFTKRKKKSHAKTLPLARYNLKFEGNRRTDLINYAMKHGAWEAAVHFSDALGAAVCEATIKNIVKKHLKDTGQNVKLSSVLPNSRPAQYNKFTPTEKRQMAKYYLKFGMSQTVTYLNELWGVRVSPGSLQSIVKQYKESLVEGEGKNSQKGSIHEKEKCSEEE